MGQKERDEALIALGFTSETEYKAAKSKKQQPETPKERQGRDLFQTPNYAVDLLIHYIPLESKVVWECASGHGKIGQRLTERGFSVFPTDIRECRSGFLNTIHNFLDDEPPFVVKQWILGKDPFIIITNPPFSLKQKFYEKCREYKVPFALLIPADYSGWIIKACQDGAEKIIPTRRIDYITPNVLVRVKEGEIWHYASDEKETYHGYKSIQDVRKNDKDMYEYLMFEYDHIAPYKSVNEIPNELLVKYSSSDFHSMWLTWRFGLGKTETFVELSLDEKKGNI